MKKLLTLTLVIFFFSAFCAAEETAPEPSTLDYPLLIVPVRLITLGAVVEFVPKDFFLGKYELQRRFSNGKRDNNIDDYAQFAPLGAAVILPLAVNVPHRSTDTDLITKAAISEISMLAVTGGMKYLINTRRPNGGTRSFPSGHTAQAFTGAQILYLEYRDTNKWLAYAGYPVAAFVGVDRVVNNAHWTSDVLAGAGIGMLVPTAVYWAKDKIYGTSRSKERSAYLTPKYTRDGKGFELGIAF